MKQIRFKVIPSADHRYKTVGDYWEHDNTLEVRVSEMEDDRLEQLVLIHELVEIFLLQNKGVPLYVTDDFDIMFEKEREQGKHQNDEEPGDDPRCPYRLEHRIAENIERQLAVALGVDWTLYTEKVNSL